MRCRESTITKQMLQGYIGIPRETLWHEIYTLAALLSTTLPPLLDHHPSEGRIILPEKKLKNQKQQHNNLNVLLSSTLSQLFWRHGLNSFQEKNIVAVLDLAREKNWMWVKPQNVQISGQNIAIKSTIRFETLKVQPYLIFVFFLHNPKLRPRKFSLESA